jgi:hypothetical protein
LSLDHDPTFLKSVLRRATAQFEAGKFTDAAVDVRHFLKFEPKISKAIDLMRKIVEPGPMTDLMRFSFVGHHLRRVLSKFDSHPTGMYFSKKMLSHNLLRVSVSIFTIINYTGILVHFFRNGSFY